MTHRTACLWMSALTLALTVGCGPSGSDTVDAGYVRVTLEAQFEKRNLTATGFGPTVPMPARFAYAEVVSGSAILAADYLGTDGTGWIDVPAGTPIQLRIYPQVQVPNNPVDTGFFMRGSVKQAYLASSYASPEAFNAVPNWVTTSDTLNPTTSGVITLRALEGTSEAGAFAIADQMVTFGLGMRALEPGLRLPNLHAFWTSGTYATYPVVVTTASGTPLKQPSGRTIFAHEVRYAAPNALDGGADAYNDGVLQETFARLLFADYSAQATYSNGAAAPDALVRRDSDNAYADPNDPTPLEASMAWTAGFGNFLSAAFRNDPTVREVATNGAVTTFQLDTHTSPLPTQGGEFVPGAVARSLWGIWTNPQIFNRSTQGLQTMWAATIPALTQTAYEYGNTPLTTYPTYLTGMKRLAGLPAATPIANELNLENVGNGSDVTSSAYLHYSSALWINEPSHTFTRTGSFPTYAAGYAYDRDQAQSYRFVQGTTAPKTITLQTAGPGLLVELFDTISLLSWAEATGSGNGVINIGSLPSGHYVVRVRVDPLRTYTNSTINYTLTVN